jgi:TatD DNase family protein
MIETHAHIYDSDFEDDRTQMLNRAFEAGITQIMMPNCNHETIAGMMALAEAYPGVCVPMMGLHPCYVKENYIDELHIIENWLQKTTFTMIGEIGLDYYWDLTHIKQQEDAFLKQLELAKSYNLPICIHSRNSKDGQHNAILRCVALIKDFGWADLRGVFHCFSGNLSEAQQVIALGFKLGIGGVATFKNGGLDHVLPYIHLSDIVLETDSPYLAPVPHRGKRNEVAYLTLIAQRVADLMQTTHQNVVTQTTQTARALITK